MRNAIRWVGRSLRSVWAVAIWGASGEWVLKLAGPSNGGDIIALRAVLTTTAIAGAYYVLVPHRTSASSASVDDNVKLFGAVFAGVYAALYTRFASQWGYLANVYGFIDDAFILHLAAKESFAGAVSSSCARSS